MSSFWRNLISFLAICAIFVVLVILFRSHRGWRDVDSLYSWAFQHLPSLVTQLNHHAFLNDVLDSEDAWIIDFYAPWCGHCIQFAPDFEKAAKVSKEDLVSWKFDENFFLRKRKRALQRRLLSEVDCALVTEKKCFATNQLAAANETIK